MSNVETAEQVVSQMSSVELARFRKWFAEFDGDAWDAQIEEDAKLGKLDAFAAEALAEYHAGKVVDVTERKAWEALSHSSLKRVWGNDADAVYDDWKSMYGVSVHPLGSTITS